MAAVTKLVYEGRGAGVTVPAVVGGPPAIEAVRGVPTEVPAEVADRLLEERPADWSKPTAKKSGGAKQEGDR